jgi:alcohol dehydrogenase (cytochrome c)
LLWEHETTSGIVAPPSSFAIDGRQYLAVHSGWGGDPRGMQAGLNRLFPGEYPPVPEGGAVWVFALDDAPASPASARPAGAAQPAR